MTAHTKGTGLKWVGRAIRRLEDPALITGQGRFTADLPAVHWVRFVFTPEQIARFREGGERVLIGIAHRNYGHMAVMGNTVRAELAKDFA